MKWTICFADREYAQQLNDPDLGQVDAETQEEAIAKGYADKEIARHRFGHAAALWAYPAKARTEGRAK